jgi:hypothetical protein
MRDRQEPAATPPRGYDGAGCDVSADMLSVAHATLPEVPLHRADMRSLPRRIGVFDWITCLDDALNYLLGDDSLGPCPR